VVVLFACVHNAGRSQMAAAWFNELVDPTKAWAMSAGTAPVAAVHPEVLEAMREAGLDLRAARPQLLTDELRHRADWLVSVGCGEVFPAVPGVEHEDWPLEDPAGQPFARVREIRDEVRRRVAEFVEQHGWSAGDLDRG
jgi:arsenate reductase